MKVSKTILWVFIISVIVLILFTVLGSIIWSKWVGVVVLSFVIPTASIFLVVILVKKLKERKQATPEEGHVDVQKPIQIFEAIANAKKQVEATFPDIIGRTFSYDVRNVGRENEAADPIFILHGQTYWDEEKFYYIQNLRYPNLHKLIPFVNGEELEKSITSASTNPPKIEKREEVPYTTPQGERLVKNIITRETPQQAKQREEEERKEEAQIV